MTYEAILKDIKARKFAPIYYLCGDEPYFIDKVTEAIESTVLTESERSFNQSVLYGGEITAGQLIDEVYRPPMMSPYLVVIVKEAQNIKKIEEFEKYFEKPIKSTILVLAAKGKKLDKRRKMTAALIKNAVVLETKRIYENQVPAWIEQYLQTHGCKASPQAVQMMADYLGNEISVITNEIDKLLINIKKENIISIDDVEKNIGISKDYNNFELQKALSYKDPVKTMRIITYFNSNPKNNPIILTIMALQTYFNTLFSMQFKRNIGDKELMSEFRLWADALQQYKAALKNFDLARNEQILLKIAEMDLRSKGVGNGHAEPGELLKELVFDILYK
jgi:DNA polymerase III subunit delta